MYARRCSSRVSELADLLSGLDGLALRHATRAQVNVEREVSTAVIDLDQMSAPTRSVTR